MIRFKNFLVVTYFCSILSWSEPLFFEKAGFTIQPLDAPPHIAGSQPLTMLLPQDQGFSANVNVQIQAFEGNLNAYRELSKKQFKALNIRVLKEELNKKQLILEYAGETNGALLHWYAKAIKYKGFIYLATATSLEKNWLQNRFELMQSVDSFTINQ